MDVTARSRLCNALKVDESGLAESLSKFRKQPSSELQISNVEYFLVQYDNQKTKTMTLMTSGIRSTIQRILTLILNSSHLLQRAYILNTLNVSIISAICGLTQQAIKVYFLIFYVVVTL